MIKIGVLGVGHLGKIHVKCIRMIEEYELVGFYDSDEGKSKEVAEEFGIINFESVSSLIDAVDVVDIVTPTLSHFEIASEAIKKSKHVFIEKLMECFRWLKVMLPNLININFDRRR